MKKVSDADKKLLKQLQAELKVLQAKLVKAKQLEGKDSFIEVKIKLNQGRFERVKKKGEEDKALGKFLTEIDITAKQQEVFIPVSIASGKKTAGFMYQIEGTAPGAIVTTEIKAKGDGVSMVTVGTLLLCKIPASKTASFRIQATTRGAFGKKYKIVISRLNYKLQLVDTVYLQYLKELHSDSVTFS